MSGTFRAYLELCRPANLLSALADVVAGTAIVGFLTPITNDYLFFKEPHDFFYLLHLGLASVFLYAGGVVFNDVFDAKLDAVERPERAIPSGRVSSKNASWFGAILLLLGIFFAQSISLFSGCVALAIAIAVLLYDRFSKHNAILGPINMGMCRSLNLLLGMSIFGWPEAKWMYLLIPLIYIAAVTLISRGEVHGNNRKSVFFAGCVYVVAFFFVIYFHNLFSQYVMNAVPFLVLFIAWIFYPLIGAYTKNTPASIGKAVKGGVLGIIALDSALLAAYAPWYWAVLLLTLLPLSIFISKRFAVT